MLRSLNDLERYKVKATDGDIGHAVNFLLDDERWVVRYLVVETKGFRDGQEVLISPISISDAQWPSKLIQLGLTKEKVRNSPSVDVSQPVSRQQEALQSRYYGYPAYWGYTGGLWGMGPYPSLLRSERWKDIPERDGRATGDVHLRSAKEVTGYHVEGNDGAIGHVADFVVEDETWAVRYLVLDTSNWWIGKKVALAPQWASEINWAQRTVHVDMSRQAIKASPEWPGPGAVNREYEELLCEHYGRPTYWAIRDNPEVALGSIPAAPPPR